MPTPRSVIAEENEGLLKPGNLDLTKRPSVPNPAGGTSSVYSMSVGFDDGEYLIPRVSEDGRLMNEDEAIAEFKKTGNHLGVFKSPEAATKYSESLHKQQAEAGDFDVLFQRAVNHPGFRELEPDKQRQVIWKLMDRDERTKPLDDNKRMEFIGKYVEAKTPRDIYNLPLEELTPEEQLSMGPTFGGQPIGRIRGVRQAEQAVKSALGVGIPRTVEGLGPIIRSGGQAAEDFLNAASERLAGSRPFDLSSDIDALERGAEAAFGPTAEWAEKIANDKRFFPEIDRTSWAEVKKSEGALDTVFNFTDWVAGGAADTFGAMAPSIWLTAVTGAPIWATMVPTMTGFQSESFREQGVEATDLELVLSGVTQSVLGAKFGVESLIGAAPNSFIKNIFSNGFRRGLWRSAGGVAGELTTEFAQEYINQQLPLWEKGDQRFWNNLNPAQKTEIVEGAMLAGVLQVPASVVGAAEVGWTEQAMDNAKKKLEALQRLRSMTPEERGAEGFVAAPRAVRPLTEDQIRQIYTNHAPEFLTDEQKTAFVLGELDTTQFPPDQQAEIEAARLAAEEEIGPQEDTAVEVVPPEQQTEQQRTGIDEIKALAILRQQQLTAEGNAEGAAEIQEAIDSIEIVQAKDAKLRTIQGFAARFAPSVTFYRAKNGHLLGSDGVSVGTNGDVFVRWDASEAHLIAAVTLHEVIHTVGKSNFDAMVALYNTLKQTLPKRVAEYETWLRNEYANIGQTLSEKDLIQETVAYIGQDNAQEIFRALQVASQNIDVKSPGPIKSLIKAMWDTVKKITKGVPGTKNLFGPAIDAEFDINNKQDYTRLANQFVKFLQTGQRESLNIQPDNFGRRGRKQLDISEAPVPPPRTPTIEEDIPPRRPLRITEDRGKRAGKRPVYDASQREPGPPEFEPRGEKLIVGEAERVEPVQAETARKAVQRELLETPEKPAEVRLGPKPREAVREPRKPTILLDEPMVRTTAAKLEVGDELEIDDEVVSVTRAELKNGKRVIHYVNRDGDVSRVTVAPTKRFMKFENPQEEALGTDQPNLFESGKKLSPEQQRLNFDAMLAEEKEIAKIASDTNFALSARPYASISEEMSDDMDVEALGRLMDIDQEITGWMRYQPPGVRPYILADETGLRGFMLMRERLHYTKDHEAYFEYIAALYDKKGNRLFGMDRYNKLGIRNVIALGPFLAKEYPNAIWAGGHRIGGTRAAETAREDVEEYTRVPVYSLRDRRAGNVPSWWDDHLIEEGSVPHSWLEQQYSFSDLYGFTPAEQTAALSSAEAELRAAEEAAGLEQGLSDQEIRAILEVEEDTVRERYDQNTTMSMDDYLRIQLALSRIDEDGNPAESTETEAAQSMRQQYERDPETFFSFSNKAGKPVAKFTSDDWNALGEKHGVANLGGMSELVEIAPGVSVPGGLDGTFTYEEILWLKHQAIDTSKLDERVHLELHKKIVRTMQPDPRDTLQTLNNFIFSMLSPNQPLTPNELAYATVRVRNDEESREWAARIPWDAPSGEEPSLEVLERDGNRRAATTFIINYFKNTEALPAVKSAKQAFFANPGEFRKAYRSFYNERITREFNLQARERKGLGLLGTAEMTNVAELNQYYQIDPGWFQMQESDVDKNGMPSWHTYVERLSTQFRGMSTKVSSFAAVWQDPMNAAISAIDRHMGQQFEAELFNTPQERLEWEIGVLERWNASQKSKKEGKITPRVEDGQLKNFDELFMAPSGDGFFVEELMTKIGSTTGVLFEAVPESRPAYTKMRPKPATFEKWNKQRQDDWLAKEEARAANAFSEWKARNAAKVMNRNKKLPPHWKQWTGNFISLPEGRTVQLMSDAYRNALSYNAEKAEQLGIGLFSSQWFLWDRYRRRLEPHEVNFPGLYKLPHLDKSQIAAARKAHSKAGYLSGTKERVPILDSEGRPTESVDIRMKPVRTAPLGSLNYYSFSEGPGHFPSGQGFRTPLYNLHQAQPLSGVNPQSGPAWGLPEKTWKTYLINKFQDKFYRVKQLQREIERRYGNIHEDMDVYLTEMLYHGKAADQVEKFEHEYVDPLLKSLHANNVDIAEFEEWLHARHAEERNAHLDEIWENRKRRNLEKEIGHIENQIEYANDQGIDTTILKRRLHRKKKELAFLPRNRHHSGMSNAQAAAILKKAGNKFDAQAALFDKMMAQKLDILYRAGLITDEELKKVSVYKYYVPLKGKEYKGDLEEILEDANIHTGQGFDIRGDELGFSFGRVGDTKHTRPVLAQAVVDIEEAIVRANKNEVGKAFLDLVNQFPNESLYKVNSVTRRRVWDKKTGTVRLVKDAFANREDNVVAVKDGGKTHYIEIYDARLATAMKNLGSGPMHGAVRLVAAFNRFMAAANTTYNPEFIIANLLRDVQTAGLNMSTEELGALRNTTLLNVPKAINAIRKAEGLTSQDAAEVEQDEWVRYFREYVEDGGKIGFFGYTDVVSKARAIQRKVERAGDHKVYTTFSYMQSVADLVSKANSSVENASRLSVYVAARQAGISRKKAAAIGRNLTVNFNKKGDAGQVLNALYLFSNASIQGTARMFGAVLGSKRLQKLVGAQIAASWAIAAMNRGLGGEDDEDGYPWWEKVGDWEKERSLIIMLPEAQGHHIKIPLPYGYNVFHVIGTQMEAVSHAILSGTSTVEGTGKGVANLFAAVMTAFNPLGGMSLDSKWQMLRPLIPSAGAPIFDTFVNQTYYGAPIAPVRSSWDHSPESQRYFKSVNPLVKELTAYLNRWTGGSEYESGWLDQNPETLEYLLGSYAGAGAKTVVRTLFTDPAWVFSALTGRDTSKYEMNDVAFLRRIFGEVNDYTAAAVFYENIPVLSQAEEAYKNLKGQQLEDWKEDNAWMIPLFKKLTEAEKGIRDTEDPDAKNKIRKRFNKEYREAWLSQF